MMHSHRSQSASSYRCINNSTYPAPIEPTSHPKSLSIAFLVIGYSSAFAMSKATESKLSHYIKAPVRALRHARDAYESSMAGIAGKAQLRGPFAGAAAPRSRGFGGAHSHSGSSSENELNELIRAACKSKMRSIPIKSAEGGGTAVARSHSVATMRIDEDRPCCFEEDLKLALGPRSKTYDVATKRKLDSKFQI